MLMAMITELTAAVVPDDDDLSMTTTGGSIRSGQYISTCEIQNRRASPCMRKVGKKISQGHYGGGSSPQSTGISPKIQ